VLTVRMHGTRPPCGPRLVRKLSSCEPQAVRLARRAPQSVRDREPAQVTRSSGPASTSPKAVITRGGASVRWRRKPRGEVCDVSRFAEVIVIARDAEQIMEPLTRPDGNREWHQCFKPVYDRYFGAPNLRDSTACFMWVIEFYRMNWRGLLSH